MPLSIPQLTLLVCVYVCVCGGNFEIIGEYYGKCKKKCNVIRKYKNKKNVRKGPESPSDVLSLPEIFKIVGKL